MRRTIGGSLIALLALACSTAYGDKSNGPGAPGAGTSQIRLSDDPFPYDRVARADVYIVSVQASLAPDTGVSAGFVTVAAPKQRYNLLDYQGGATALLNSVSLPVGYVRAVRMVIDTDSSSLTLRDGRVLTSTSSPGIQWQSSAGRPTLNATVLDTIRVSDSGAVVVIDYDVGAAFIPVQVVAPGSTDSSFIFSPVLGARDARRTGSISGIVRAGTAGGAPVANASIQLYLPLSGLAAENTWSVIGHARTDANGVFKLPFVVRSAFWRGGVGQSYNVAIDPPAGMARTRQVILGVSVVPLQDAALGTVVLP